MKAFIRNLTLLPLWFTSMTLILYACASGHQAPFTDTPPPQRNLSAYEQRLQKAVTSSRHLFLEEIGRVSYPGFEAPLWRICFRPDDTVKYKILFSAGGRQRQISLSPDSGLDGGIFRLWLSNTVPDQQKTTGHQRLLGPGGQPLLLVGLHQGQGKFGSRTAPFGRKYRRGN